MNYGRPAKSSFLILFLKSLKVVIVLCESGREFHMLEKLCKNIPRRISSTQPNEMPKARKNIHDKFDDGRKYIPLKRPGINRVTKCVTYTPSTP